MNPNECPKRADLEDYATGVLSTERAAQLDRHFERCSRCDETMSELETSTDGLLSKLRSPGKIDELHSLSEPEYRRAVEAICRRDFSQPGIPHQTTQIGRHEGQRPRDPQIHAMFKPGDRIGQYELQEVIGRGGMGVVFRARQLKLNRIVAIKLLSDSKMLDQNTQQRFEREIHAIGQLDHPNIVRALAADEINGIHFLVMEHVPGTDLSKWLKTRGRLSISAACDFVRQAALGLDHIHKHEMVHRDLKPGNLMVTEDGKIKILDLGLALLSDTSALVGREATETGQLMGTLDFMAPEQCGDEHAVDIRSDIYSLGATLFALLSGHAPFSGERYPTIARKLSAIVNKPAPNVSTSRPDVPPELKAVVSGMLAKAPADRYQTPRELVEALAPFCSHSMTDVSSNGKPQTAIINSTMMDAGLPASPRNSGPPAPRFMWKHRSALIILSAITIAATAFFGIKRWPAGDSGFSISAQLSMSQKPELPAWQKSSAPGFRTQRQVAEHVISVGGIVLANDASGHGDWRTSVSELIDAGLVITGVEFPKGTIVSPEEIKPVMQLPSMDIYSMISHRHLTREHLKLLHELGKCDRLRMLVLGTQTPSDINDDDVAALLKNLPDLEHLALFSFSLDGSCLHAIQNPEKITWLTMVSPGVDVLTSDRRSATLDCIRDLQRFTALDTLDLSGASLSTEHFRLLSDLLKLKALMIMGTKNVDVNLDAVLSIPNLSELNLMNTGLTDAQLSVLSGGVRLRHLDLRNNGLTKDGIDRLHTALPNCTIESDFGLIEPIVVTEIAGFPAVLGADASIMRSASVDSSQHLRRLLETPAIHETANDDSSPWRIFSSAVDPDLRSDAIHQAVNVIPIATLLLQLQTEPHASTRAGLVLALSEYDRSTACSVAETMSSQPLDLVDQVRHWYVKDPDPEVHSCIDFLLGSWQLGDQRDELRPLVEQKMIPFEGGWYQPFHVSAMVVIPGPLTAELGSPENEPGRNQAKDLREDQRSVTIPYTFAISATEVTRLQYWRMSQNYWESDPPTNPQTPVNNILWQKAAEFCNRVSTLEGLSPADLCYEPYDADHRVLLREKPNALELTGYRLPTDDEWEVACRAGTRTMRPDGNSGVWSQKFLVMSEDSSPSPAAVASCKPNSLGLFDMLGNVSEWTQTGFSDSSTKQRMRRIRGGSVWTQADGLRSAARYFYQEAVTTPKIGFRVARTLMPRPYEFSENGQRSDRIQLLAGPPACPDSLRKYTEQDFVPITEQQVIRVGNWDARSIPGRRFRLNNNGQIPLKLDSLPWMNGLFVFESEPALEMAPNSFAEFSVRMTAKSAGERSHDLSFRFDGFEKHALPPLRIHGCLNGTVLAVHNVGFLGHEAERVDFGCVPQGAKHGLRLYMYNTGETKPEAKVTRVTGPFHLVEQLEGPIVRLDNSFRIELNADTLGNAEGSVTVSLTEDSSWNLTFPVTAVVNAERPFSQPGLFRQGQWRIDFNRDGTPDDVFRFGEPGDLPLTGDWNGDGICDVGVWHKDPAGQPVVQLLLRGENPQPALGKSEFQLPGSHHTPIAADYDGDGRTDPGYVVPAASGDRLIWGFDVDHQGDFKDSFAFGRPGDDVVIGDWNGDGTDDFAVSRSGAPLHPLQRYWEIRLSDGLPRQFAASLDIPVAGDWDGDGDDDFGVWRPLPDSRSSLWQFDTNGDGQPNYDMEGFGTEGDIPIVLRVRRHRDRN